MEFSLSEYEISCEKLVFSYTYFSILSTEIQYKNKNCTTRIGELIMKKQIEFEQLEKLGNIMWYQLSLFSIF